MNYEYGYTITAKGESRRVVLGQVARDQYDATEREINSAQFVSSRQGDTQTKWFINPLSTLEEAQ